MNLGLETSLTLWKANSIDIYLRKDFFASDFDDLYVYTPDY